MATIERQISPEQRVVLRGVPWAVYETLRDLHENDHLRMTYDGGTLEVMSPSGEHEGVAKLLAQLIEAFTAELGIPRRSFRSTTWRRSDLEKGLEADECYYIRNHRLVSLRAKVELGREPPPDLAIEVVVHHDDVDKMAVYAALGVGEVWGWRDGELQAYVLDEIGRYGPVEMSLNLPMLRVKELEPFLDPEQALDESAWINSFRAWVRERFG
ncbi:MAG TPA: Uma2 family endonuclease [Pirellulales bacterium]|jgi:Uma2 family endonuclease|nr:Uma2 family endonuclease [Pirellulales bacterium]